MTDLGDYNVCFWDFDGVILDSMKVRDLGFEKVLANYSSEQVDELMRYHRANGGLSRYHKFRYFFERIRNEKVSEDVINSLASQFSKIMTELLVNEKLLIDDSLSFIKENHQKYKMYIVSGSDEIELNYLCESLKISKYFIEIKGSPTPKSELVEIILRKYNYDRKQAVLIGDSNNDFEAATANGIHFLGYNNKRLQNIGQKYIESFQ